MINKTILFSGRFDRPHPGHYLTILRLAKKYKMVLVVILDYPEQAFSVQYRAQQMKEFFSHCNENIEVIVNKEHFAVITKEQCEKYRFDAYGSGNQECLKHMEELGYEIEYVDRAYDYEATDDRQIQILKKYMK